MTLTATAVGLESLLVATATFTDAQPHNVYFATSGLPSGVSVTVSWGKTNPAGHSASGTTTFTSPGPSASEGTTPGTTFTYSFPISVTVSGVTYNLFSSSPLSPFTTGASGGSTTVTASYALEATSILDVSGMGSYGGEPTLTAKLVDSGGSGVNGKSINFYTSVDGGETYVYVDSATTAKADGVDGVATREHVDLTGIDAGRYADGVKAIFEGGDGYSGSEGTGKLTVAKADAKIVVTPYDVTYDGNVHTATGTAKGVLNESLSGLDLSGTTHTAAGDYPTDPWTFTDVTGNYKDANGTVHDRIRYNWRGFFQPVDNPPTINVVQAGRAIPVKFSLSGNKGLSIFATGYPAQRIIPVSGGPEDLIPIDETVTAGASGLSYDPSVDQYIYVWKTDKAWAGTCRQLIVRLNDGIDHMATFRFTK